MICTWPKAGDALFGSREVDEILRGYIRSLFPEDQADVVLKKSGIKEFKTWKETVVSPALARSETAEFQKASEPVVENTKVIYDKDKQVKNGESYINDRAVEIQKQAKSDLKEITTAYRSYCQSRHA